MSQETVDYKHDPPRAQTPMGIPGMDATQFPELDTSSATTIKKTTEREHRQFNDWEKLLTSIRVISIKLPAKQATKAYKFVITEGLKHIANLGEFPTDYKSFLEAYETLPELDNYEIGANGTDYTVIDLNLNRSFHVPSGLLDKAIMNMETRIAEHCLAVTENLMRKVLTFIRIKTGYLNEVGVMELNSFVQSLSSMLTATGFTDATMGGGIGMLATQPPINPPYQPM